MVLNRRLTYPGLACALVLLGCGALPPLIVVQPKEPQPPQAEDRPKDGSTDRRPRRTAVRLIDMAIPPDVGSPGAAPGTEVGYNVAQWLFDRDHDGEIDDEDRFIRLLNDLVPHRFDGVIALDWEKPTFDWLRQPPSSEHHRRAIRRMKRLYRLAKVERPEASIGFYGLPLRDYWSRNEAWRAKGEALLPLLLNVDWIGVSVYDFYRNSAGEPLERVEAYVQEHVELALELAEKAHGKPVFAWIHHRYHPSNKSFGKQLIPEEEFRHHVRAALDAEWNDRRLDGLIWWGADEYWGRRGELPESIGGDAAEHARQVHDVYLPTLLDVVREQTNERTDSGK